MLTSLIKLAVAKVLEGRGRSWVYGSVFLTLLRLTRYRRRVVSDKLSTKAGDTIVVEHLGITHKQQIKQMKAEKKAKKQHEKTEIAAAKQLKKEIRRARMG